MPDKILAASNQLMLGGVVALPTETVYGLAANALNPAAVKIIFEIKGRPLHDPLILHVLDALWIQKFAEIGKCSERVKKITDAFWPGPITIILPKKNIIPDVVTAGLSTVAIRCPSHEIFRKILATVNVPLAAPSANPFGYVSPTSADQVKNTLGDKIDIIVDGGECTVGLESTILDLTQPIVKILRPGAITAEQIKTVLGEDVIDYVSQIVADKPTTPGQLKQHYCTNTRLILFAHGSKIHENFNEKTAVIFCQKPENLEKTAKILQLDAKNIFWLSDDDNQKTVAKNLFARLQQLDNANYDTIFCERPLRAGIGIAIDDRLSRAAAKFSN